MSIVTAVIPSYNAAAFLEEAIASVKAQSVPPAEILVVDDGSEDHSVSLARAAGARVLSTGGRLGPGAARNVGAREAGTPYLAFLDADDCWLPDHCGVLLDLVQENPGAAVAFGRVQRFGPNGDLPMPAGYAGLQCDLIQLLRDNPIAQSASVVDRSKLLAAGGYREDLLGEDYDLWLRLAERYPIVGSDRVTCRYRVHAGQISHALPRMIRGGWKARLACRERLRQRGELTPSHEAQLLQALGDDVRNAWDTADREAFSLLFAISRELAGSAELQRAIRHKIRMLPLRRLTIAVRRLAQPSETVD